MQFEKNAAVMNAKILRAHAAERRSIVCDSQVDQLEQGLPGGIPDCRADAGRGLRACRGGSPGEHRVAQLNFNETGIQPESFSGGFRDDRVRAGAQVLSSRADEDPTIRKDAHDGLSGGAGGVAGAGTYSTLPASRQPLGQTEDIPLSPENEKDAAAALSSPAVPFSRQPGHFPANIAAIYSYPECAAAEKTEWRWTQSGANCSPTDIPCIREIYREFLGFRFGEYGITRGRRST